MAVYYNTRIKIAASEAPWRLPSPPIVEKNMWFPYVNSKVYWFTQGSPNPLFYRCKFSPREQIRLLFRKTRTKIGDSEPYWRLPSSPIVEKKHVVSLCKFKSVLIYTWIAKPFVLPLQIFGTRDFYNKKMTFVVKPERKFPHLRDPGGSRRRQ